MNERRWLLGQMPVAFDLDGPVASAKNRGKPQRDSVKRLTFWQITVIRWVQLMQLFIRLVQCMLLSFDSMGDVHLMLSEMAVGLSAEQQLRSSLTLSHSLSFACCPRLCHIASGQATNAFHSSHLLILKKTAQAFLLSIEWNGIHTSKNQVCGRRRSWFGMVRWLALRRVGEVPLTHTHHAQGKTALLVSYTSKEFPREYMPVVFESTLARMLAGQVHNQ